VQSGKSDAIAIRIEAEAISYAQLQDRLNRLGHALPDLGTTPGDRVLVCFLTERKRS